MRKNDNDLSFPWPWSHWGDQGIFTSFFLLQFKPSIAFDRSTHLNWEALRLFSAISGMTLVDSHACDAPGSPPHVPWFSLRRAGLRPENREPGFL
jgi:hypothetical protein